MANGNTELTQKFCTKPSHNKSLELDNVPTVSKMETVEPLFNNSKNDNIAKIDTSLKA